MSKHIEIPVGKEAPVNCGWIRVPIGNAYITDAIAAEIVRRALVHDDTVRAGIAGLIQRLEDNTKPAEDAGQGDDAASVMAASLRRNGRTTAADFVERQASVISAIRSQLYQFEKDKADAAGELRVSVTDCAPGTLAGKLLSANVLLRHANGDLLARAADAEQERDELRAKLEDMETLTPANMKQIQSELEATRGSVRVQALRADKALAELAALRLEYTSLERSYVSWVEAKKRATDDYEKARAELDAMTERAEKAEAGLSATINGHWYGRAVTAESQRDAARAEADALRAAGLHEQEAATLAKMEADALRAEVAALKARKVKLPSADASASGREGDDYHAYADGLRSMLVSCEDAIRAAGVEVA